MNEKLYNILKVIGMLLIIIPICIILFMLNFIDGNISLYNPIIYVPIILMTAGALTIICNEIIHWCT